MLWDDEVEQPITLDLVKVLHNKLNKLGLQMSHVYSVIYYTSIVWSSYQMEVEIALYSIRSVHTTFFWKILVWYDLYM